MPGKSPAREGRSPSPPPRPPDRPPRAPARSCGESPGRGRWWSSGVPSCCRYRSRVRRSRSNVYQGCSRSYRCGPCHQPSSLYRVSRWAGNRRLAVSRTVSGAIGATSSPPSSTRARRRPAKDAMPATTPTERSLLPDSAWPMADGLIPMAAANSRCDKSARRRIRRSAPGRSNVLTRSASGGGQTNGSQALDLWTVVLCIRGRSRARLSRHTAGCLLLRALLTGAEQSTTVPAPCRRVIRALLTGAEQSTRFCGRSTDAGAVQEAVSEGLLQPHPEGPPVGVVEQAVDRCGPESSEQRQFLGSVLTQAAWRAGPASAAFVPGVEGGGPLVQDVDEPSGVEGFVVLTAVGGEVQVLAGERQPQVAGERSRALTRAGRITWLAWVAGGVQHGAGQFAVVGPRAAVEVVAADARPGVV